MELSPTIYDIINMWSVAIFYEIPFIILMILYDQHKIMRTL